MPPAAPPPSGAPIPAPPGTDYPGKTLGIVGLILSFFTTIIGLIISAVALSQSKKAGFKNTPALVGVIIGSIGVVVGIIIAIVAIVTLVAVGNQCAQLGNGEHEVNGVTITCNLPG
jgi:hypothetical protein